MFKKSGLDLIYIFSLLFITTALSAQIEDEGDIVSNQCDLYNKIPIDMPIDETESLLGKPTTIDDISLQVYTWRVDDSFLTLQYDRNQLTAVEVSQKCDSAKYKSTKICEYFSKFRKGWPEYKVVEKEIGKPIETNKIPRDEWIWKNKTEVVYIEVQENLVKKVDCVPNKIKYIYEEDAEE